MRSTAVASDVPGLRDAVIDGETGLLYEYGNIEQLAEKILLLLRDERLSHAISGRSVILCTVSHMGYFCKDHARCD